MKLVHRKTILIEESHLDANRHVNNVQYVSWINEIAFEHWELLKNSTPYAADYWVMVDHHIQYKKQAFLGEEIQIETFPEVTNGVKQPRKVLIYRGKELLAESTTLWALVDGQTHRVRRLMENWLDSLLPQPAMI